MAYGWTHESDTLAADAAEGIARAASGDWGSGAVSDRVRSLRGALVLSAYHAARLSGRVTETADGARVEIAWTPGATGERERAAEIIAETWALIARADALPGAPEAPGSFATRASRAPDTGALPALAVVAVVAIGTVGIAYCASKAAEVIDRQLARSHQSRELARADTATQALVEAHLAAEAAAGKTLPLAPPMKTALDALAARQREFARTLPPLQSEFTPASWMLPAGIILAGIVIAGPAVRRALD